MPTLIMFMSWLWMVLDDDSKFFGSLSVTMSTLDLQWKIFINFMNNTYMSRVEMRLASFFFSTYFKQNRSQNTNFLAFGRHNI